MAFADMTDFHLHLMDSSEELLFIPSCLHLSHYFNLTLVGIYAGFTAKEFLPDIQVTDLLSLLR